MVRTLNMHSNLVGRVRISIRMLRILFEWLEFAFECFESRTNSWIWIRMVRTFEYAFECFESCSKCSNFYSNASNPFQNIKICSYLNASNLVQMVRIFIWMIRNPFEWLELNFVSNLVQKIQICIWMVECKFAPFKWDSKHSNTYLLSNG